MIAFIFSAKFMAGFLAGMIFTGFAVCTIAAMAKASANNDEDWQ